MYNNNTTYCKIKQNRTEKMKTTTTTATTIEQFNSIQFDSIQFCIIVLYLRFQSESKMTQVSAGSGQIDPNTTGTGTQQHDKGGFCYWLWLWLCNNTININNSSSSSSLVLSLWKNQIRTRCPFSLRQTGQEWPSLSSPVQSSPARRVCRIHPWRNWYHLRWVLDYYACAASPFCGCCCVVLFCFIFLLL